MRDTATRSHVEALCPLRPEQRCSLCVPGATGPQDCPTVALVMDDDELRAELTRRRRAARQDRARL